MMSRFGKMLAISLLLGLLLHPFTHLGEHGSHSEGFTVASSVECPICIAAAPTVPGFVPQPLAWAEVEFEAQLPISYDALSAPAARGRAPPQLS